MGLMLFFSCIAPGKIAEGVARLSSYRMYLVHFHCFVSRIVSVFFSLATTYASTVASVLLPCMFRNVSVQLVDFGSGDKYSKGHPCEYVRRGCGRF